MNRALKAVRGIAVAGTIAALVQGVGAVASGPMADANSGRMVATTAVNIRPTPGTSGNRLGVLYPGQSVTAIGTDNGWTQVTWNGRTAWVSSEYLRGSGSSGGSSSQPVTSNPSAPASGSAYTTAPLNIRTGPGTNHPRRFVAPRGTSLTLTGSTSNGFNQVIYRGQTLWASAAYLTGQAGAPSQSLPEVTGKGRATARLMIRTTNTSNYRNIETVPVGTILDTTGTVTNGMAQVVYKGNVRWVNNRYLRPVNVTPAPTTPVLPKTSTRYATANLNIWSGSTGNAHTGLIPRGSAFEATGTVQSGRLQIVHNGAVKWVTARYTSVNAPVASPAPGSNTGSGSASLNRGYSSGLDRTNRYVQRIAQEVWDTRPAVKTQYGWRRSNTPDHPAGRALDIMIPNWGSSSGKALGNEIAAYYRTNAREYNIHYIIWDQKIWNIKRDREGWRPMANRGNASANHLDHVHITTYDN